MLDRNGDCPLYVAVGGGDIGIVNQLLEYGAEADITTLTSGGRPPLFAAAESGILEVFQRLLGFPDAETTLMLLDNFSESILSAASRGGCVEIVQELLDRGVGKHIAVPTKSGQTPLSNAAFNGYVEIVRLFLSVPQVPVNLMDNYGVTPLFSAARFGHLETVEVLLSNAAIEVNCENWKCLTPLHAAVANGHVEVAEVLISKGATIVVWPTAGQSLLWWAERTGKLSMVQLLESNGVTQDSLGPFRYFRRDAPPEDAATVVFDRSMGYCDVCTLTVEDDKGHGCDKCCEMFGEEMIICSECLDREYDVCRNDHTLEKREKLCY
jgi:ankyrin repeat protein